MNYGNISGGKMMFALNVYNQYTGSVKELEIVKSIRNSKRFSDTDEIVIVLTIRRRVFPSNYDLKSKFGNIAHSI
jgi:hypothetical protein